MRERIELHGACDAAGLAERLPEGALVVCDCGGCELDDLPLVTRQLAISEFRGAPMA